MVKSRLLHFLLSFIMIFTVVGGIFVSQTSVFAQDQTSPTPTSTTPPLTLECPYPALAADSSQTFAFSIDIHYNLTARQTFNLITNAPSGWTMNVTGSDGTTQITTIQMAATDDQTPDIETVNINMVPGSSPPPTPGTYKGSFKIVAGSINESMDLQATVTPSYAFAINVKDSNGTAYTNVNINTNAGKGNSFTFDAVNSGTAAIDNIGFTAAQPPGWSVTFSPNNIPSLGARLTQQVTAVITPPNEKNIEGDYILTLNANSATASANMTLRATVPGSNLATWIVVGILIAVAIVLVGVFQFLSGRKVKRPA